MLRMVSRTALAAGTLLLLLQGATAQTPISPTFEFNYTDPAGVGFYDTTPVAPVEGNTGTTLGEQRRIAMAAAASNWSDELLSRQALTITVDASMPAFPSGLCTSTRGPVGQARPSELRENFANVPRPNTFCPIALARSISGADLSPGSPDIVIQMNGAVGSPDCLTQGLWYGTPGPETGNRIPFVQVAEHEIAHGLGFTTGTNFKTGIFISGADGDPIVYNTMIGQSVNPAIFIIWPEMTPAQRVNSATSAQLLWDGTKANQCRIGTLTQGLSVERHTRENVRTDHTGTWIIRQPFRSGLCAKRIDGARPDGDVSEGYRCFIATRSRLADQGTEVYRTDHDEHILRASSYLGRLSHNEHNLLGSALYLHGQLGPVDHV
ncbi:hypothetical protein [Hyphomonas sp.]|uniref:hypothetical protein n=1 Tax=Hyphomonas sp. TaxID=87 RepID=UPI003566AE2A